MPKSMQTNIIMIATHLDSQRFSILGNSACGWRGHLHDRHLRSHALAADQSLWCTIPGYLVVSKTDRKAWKACETQPSWSIAFQSNLGIEFQSSFRYTTQKLFKFGNIWKQYLGVVSTCSFLVICLLRSQRLNKIPRTHLQILIHQTFEF